MTSSELPNNNWSLTQKLTFRFIFTYILLYILLMFAAVFLESPLIWFAENILHWGSHLKVQSTGSGDQTYNYVLIGFNLFLVLIIVPIWSYFDRRRNSYSTLLQWFLLFIRSVLFVAMFLYGSVKLIKGQFPDPSLYRLLQPIGELSPMGLAWTFMGYSFIYNIFIGFAEVLGALLLMFRKTVTLGSLVIIGVMSNVAIMNFTYDIPVKLFSLHLLLMATILLSADLNRLIKFFIRNKATESVDYYVFFKNLTLRKLGSALRGFVVFVVLFATTIQIFVQFNAHDQLKEKSEFYGIWEVEKFESNGAVLPPLTTDYYRWEYFIVDSKRIAIVKTMTGNIKSLNFDLVPDQNKITFSYNIKSTSYPFTYAFTNSSSLMMNGVLQGDTLTIQLNRKPLSDFHLINRKFRWISERPFNR
ncbi:MAG: hypothetical protein JXR20_07100 [Balneola sp.]